MPPRFNLRSVAAAVKCVPATPHLAHSTIDVDNGRTPYERVSEIGKRQLEFEWKIKRTKRTRSEADNTPSATFRCAKNAVAESKKKSHQTRKKRCSAVAVLLHSRRQPARLRPPVSAGKKGPWEHENLPSSRHGSHSSSSSSGTSVPSQTHTQKRADEQAHTICLTHTPLIPLGVTVVCSCDTRLFAFVCGRAKDFGDTNLNLLNLPQHTHKHTASHTPSVPGWQIRRSCG